MRILFDGRTIRERPAGVGYVATQLLKNLAKKSDIEFIVFTRKGIKKIPGLENVTVHETPYEYELSSIKRFWFEQYHLPQLIKQYKPDILHLTDSFGVPYVVPNNLKIILTLHDLIPLSPYKELMTPFEYFLYRISIGYSLHKANTIACISQSTEKNLEYFFPDIDKNRIQVITNGVTIPGVLEKSIKEALLKKINCVKPYIFYLGGFSTRKNVLTVIKAFENFNKINNFKYQLIVSGRFSSHKEIRKNIETMKNYLNENDLTSDVIMLDFLSRDEKYILLENALFFVYLSLFEGFGLPVLEALTVGTPVLTSKISAMEEVAGNYALYADPKDILDIEKKMMMLISDYPSYKDKSRKAITELIPLYKWQTISEKYYKLYESIKS